MTKHRAITAERIFDGDRWHHDFAVLTENGAVASVLPIDALPPGVATVDAGAMLVPGLVDLQVNGGGGVMLNDAPDAEGIETVCRAHARLGTTALLATLITDRPEVGRLFSAAGAEASRRNIPGFLGLHFEGPHIAVARKGAHDAGIIRPLDEADRAFLIAARAGVPHLMVTLAPEAASLSDVSELAAAGVVVSLGHTDTSYADARAYAGAGATLATHLFNAMSQLGSREPGLVGAVLDNPLLWSGIIADGVHVHPASIAAALRAKRGPGRIFVVSDAMAVAGSDIASFSLAGRTVTRSSGRLTLADGTLAGADTNMAASVRYLHQAVGVDLDEALRMGSRYPAEAIGAGASHGRLAPGYRADMVALADDLKVAATWIGGEPVN